MEHVTLMRPRLLARLDEARRHRLTLLNAAAGYGKTTLLEQWQPETVFRLTCTEADRDPLHFDMHLLAAIERRYPQARARIVAREHAHLPAELLNALALCHQEITVIFDGYEHVHHHTLIEQAVEYAPPTLHLVIATRRRPALPLGRLRARGQLLELNAADLALTPEETADYLAQTCGATGEISVALHNLTAGWGMGLRRAAALLAEGLATGEIIRRLENDPALAWHFDAVAFGNEPAPVRAALLAAADTGRLETARCDAAVLERLEAGHLFITAEEGGMGYRLHPLYAAFLRGRAALHRQGVAFALYVL